jgi:hypothetical protein
VQSAVRHFVLFLNILLQFVSTIVILDFNGWRSFCILFCYQIYSGKTDKKFKSAILIFFAILKNDEIFQLKSDNSLKKLSNGVGFSNPFHTTGFVAKILKNPAPSSMTPPFWICFLNRQKSIFF